MGSAASLLDAAGLDATGPDAIGMDAIDDPDLSPVRSFGFRLWHLKHAWTRRLESVLAPLGLTHMQYVILRAADYLARDGGQPTQARLAEVLATDRMMVSKVMRLLDAKGLVVRATHPDDARAHQIVLTEAGRRVLRDAIEVATRTQSAFFGRLGPDRQQQFGAMLDELLALEGCPIFCGPQGFCDARGAPVPAAMGRGDEG